MTPTQQAMDTDMDQASYNEMMRIMNMTQRSGADSPSNVILDYWQKIQGLDQSLNKGNGMYTTIEDPKIEDFGRLAFTTPVKPGNYNKRFVIIVAGVGGTGGYVVRDLSRFLYSINKRAGTEYDIKMVCVDPDIVEEKNLLRQNFLPNDLGQNKAEVLASRHAKAFGIEIASVPQKLDRRLLETITGQYPNMVPVIVGCVDNNLARREIHSFVSRNSRTVLWIDSGNEKTSGQVILGSSKGWPTVVDMFKEILDDTKDTVAEVSCAERLMQGEQNIFVNLTAANHVLNFLRTIILNETTATNGVRFNISGKVVSFALTEDITETASGDMELAFTKDGFKKMPKKVSRAA
jgi:PRTRC genetic system ThiF family protein